MAQILFDDFTTVNEIPLDDGAIFVAAEQKFFIKNRRYDLLSCRLVSNLFVFFCVYFPYFLFLLLLGFDSFIEEQFYCDLSLC